jgi:hypothetical protein
METEYGGRAGSQYIKVHVHTEWVAPPGASHPVEALIGSRIISTQQCAQHLFLFLLGSIGSVVPLGVGSSPRIDYGGSRGGGGYP